VLCTITDVSATTTFICLLASIHHLVLMSAERYVAIKHPFTHETQVTEVRIIMASALAWAAAIILYIVAHSQAAIVVILELLLIILPVYFNVSVYKEVLRNEKQIAANQVSLEAKERLLKKGKAFYTTTIVLFVILLCYIPSGICGVILISFKERIPSSVTVAVLFASGLFPVLNSLFNPLIYAVRIKCFRVALIQLFARKTTSQAEQVERKIFGPRQIKVNGNVDAGQGNQTLKDEHQPTTQTEPYGG